MADAQHPSPQPTAKPVVLLVNLDAMDGSKAEGFTARTLLDVRHGRELRITAPSPDAKDSKQVLASIMQIVREQVKEHGMFDEIRFSGEGNPRSVFHGKDAIPLNIGDLLNGLRDVQKSLGVQLADKISFLACNTFTILSAQDVAFLRNKSKELGAEIIGTTDYISKTAIPGIENIKVISFFNGEVGQYTPNTASIGTELLLKARAVFSDDAKYSSHWLECHKGKTQTEGAACQQRFEVNESSKVELPASPATPAKPTTGTPSKQR